MPRSNKDAPTLQIDDVSPFMEAYRTLKANIEFASRRKPIRAVAVASAVPGEGKSTTALYLASAYARAGRNVVLIDGDIRKPTLHQVIDRRRSPGLTDYLLDPGMMPSYVLTDTIVGAAFIGAGRSVPNPSDLLASERMTELIALLKQAYDMIIVDTPPILAAIAAKILAAKCDGVVLVLESGKAREKAVLKAKAELTQANANLLGAVLNKLNRKAMDPYYTDYGK